nr:hypothetical protein [Tanacetum cinerariifolium]
EEEEDPEEDPKKDDDDMEMDDEVEVINPYMDDGSNNPPPLNSKDEETPPTSPVIPDVDGQPIPPIASFGQNFHFGCDNIKMDRAVRNVMSDLTMPPRKSTRGNPPPPLILDTMNRMIHESVEAASGLRERKREKVQNEANRAGGPNIAPVA